MEKTRTSTHEHGCCDECLNRNRKLYRNDETKEIVCKPCAEYLCIEIFEGEEVEN